MRSAGHMWPAWAYCAARNAFLGIFKQLAFQISSSFTGVQKFSDSDWTSSF